MSDFDPLAEYQRENRARYDDRLTPPADKSRVSVEVLGRNLKGYIIRFLGGEPMTVGRAGSTGIVPIGQMVEGTIVGNEVVLDCKPRVVVRAVEQPIVAESKFLVWLPNEDPNFDPPIEQLRFNPAYVAAIHFSGLKTGNVKLRKFYSFAPTLPDLKGLILLYMPTMNRLLTPPEIVELRKFQGRKGLTVVSGVAGVSDNAESNAIMEFLGSPLRCSETTLQNRINPFDGTPYQDFPFYGINKYIFNVDGQEIITQLPIYPFSSLVGRIRFAFTTEELFPALFGGFTKLWIGVAARIDGGVTISKIPVSRDILDATVEGADVPWIAYDKASRTVLAGDPGWAYGFTDQDSPLTATFPSGAQNIKFMQSLLTL